MLNEYCFGDIYIRHAIDEIPDDKEFTMHIHDQCEIYFFISGDVEYLVEGSKYPLSESSLLIMSPAEAHKPKIVGRSRYERYAINFPANFVSLIDPECRLTNAFTERPLGKNNILSAQDIDMKLVNKLFSEMTCDNDEYSKQLTIKTHLLMLLDMIDRAYSVIEKAHSKPPSTAQRIIMYVNEQLFEDISVSDLAKHFYLSPSQFSRIFHQATGSAPWDYIVKKRLTSAKEMIRSGHSAQSASESCGFKDYSVFYRAYTKHFGCSPKHDH